MRCDDIGVNVSRDQFVEFLNGVQPGQFFHIRGYVNDQGEKADHILRFGIKYGNLKERDAALLRDILAGNRQEVFGVVHGSWIPAERLDSLLMTADQIAALPEVRRKELVQATIRYESQSVRVQKVGIIDPMDVFTFSNRKSKDKVQATVSYRLSSAHPLVIAAIGDPDYPGSLLQSLEAPREAHTEYDKEARSCYSMTKEGQPERWYIRDVLRVYKTVRVPGDYKFAATIPLNATKEAISKALLLTAKYRQFVLTDGQFESITIEGQAVLVDGINEEFYFALPEAVRATAETV
jgi:hypothetical protein